MAACVVSFVDLDGIRHSAEVEADGLYEASVLGLCAFRKHELEPGGLTQLEVEVRSSVTHTLTVTKVREWLPWCENAEGGGTQGAIAVVTICLTLNWYSMLPRRERTNPDRPTRAILGAPWGKSLINRSPRDVFL